MAPVTYEISIPVITRALKNLQHFLKKGEQWAKDNDVPVSTLLEGKLAEDMKPLPFHIQTCSNSAKFIPVRVAGAEALPMDDNETTFEQLYERIEKTLEYIAKTGPEKYEGKETAEVTMKAGPSEFKFTGLSYIQNFVLPNFFFHEVTAYAILRNLGVPVGKMDFLAGAEAL